MNTSYFVFVFILMTFLITQLDAQPKVSVHQSYGNITGVPDLILYNANVITLEEQTPTAQALAIEGNVIGAVGSNNDILAMQTATTQLIDLQGRTVVPGLIEGHSHVLRVGYISDGIDGLRRAANNMAADGFTTVHELGYITARNPGFLASAAELAERGELAVRMNVYLAYNNSCGEELTDNWNSHSYTSRLDTMVRVVGVKTFGDGGSCNTSCISTEWQDGPAAGGFGDCYFSQTKWDSIFTMILSAGYPIAMHALGDSAVAVGLNAFEHAFATSGNALRCRMEHLRVMREDLADQMAALSIGGSIQYTWAVARRKATFEAVYLPQVWDWLFPWRKMADRGIRILGGNDGPNFTTITHSMQTISFLATRKEERADSLYGWMDGNQLTVEEGLRAMTVDNAWICYEENVKGTITAGKLADLTVLSTDPLVTEPFDVRDIQIEMTVMDGIIRHNKLNQNQTALHDAGTFIMAISDEGIWGDERLSTGLLYEGEDLLYSGSLLISYDQNTVATADNSQRDFITSPGGQLQFLESTQTGTEYAAAIFEDDVDSHPGKIQVKQETYMSPGDPFLLLNYTFKNIGSEPVNDIHIGQFMNFTIGDFQNNVAVWEPNDGLGFAYMYENDNPVTPYVGLVMFDESGQSVNSSLTFNISSRIQNGTELQFAAAMRSDSIEMDLPGPGNYKILPATGPFSVAAHDSISPFLLAIVVGNNPQDLRDAVQDAFQGSTVITGVSDKNNRIPGKYKLFQNYPNPFNPATTIEFILPKAEHLTVEVFDINGQKVATLMDQVLAAGKHKLDFDALALASGVYFYTIEAGSFRAAKKMLFLK